MNQNPYGKIIVPYKNPTPGMLPIVGSGKLIGYSYLTEKFLRMQKELGINIAQAAMSASAGDQVFCDVNGEKKYNHDCAKLNYGNSSAIVYGHMPNQEFSLYNAKRAEIKMFIRFEPKSITSLADVEPEGPVWTSNIRFYNVFFRETKMFSDCKAALAGFWLMDEPSLSAFLGLREVRYAILRNELESSSSATSDSFEIPASGSSITISSENVIDYPILSNLYPYLEVDASGSVTDPQSIQLNGILNSCSPNDIQGWGPVKTYKDYFEAYYSNLEPGLVCFDAYPFRHSGDEKLKLSSKFFSSLAFFMQQRKEKGITFWSTILGMGVTLYNKDTGKVSQVKPVPTLSQLKYAVYCSLAFGAQGLVYWRVTEGPNVVTDGKIIEEYKGAPIDKKCARTDTFYLIQEVNQSVRRYQSIFLTEEENLISCDIDACVSQWPETDGNTSANSKDYYKNVPLRVFKNDGIHTFGLLKRVNEGANLAFGIITKKYKGTLQSFKEYLIVVNLDIAKKQEIKLTFTSKVKDEMASPTPPPLITPGSNEYSHSYNTERVNDYSNRENTDDKDERVGTNIEENISSFTGVLNPGDWRIFSSSGYILNT